MSQAQPYKLPFESRLARQSRPVVNELGDIEYKHNSWLEVGEHLELVMGGAGVVVAEGSYWDPISRKEFIKVLVPRQGGGEERKTVPATAVRRKRIYTESY